MKEDRKIKSDSVRALCIRENLFTRGNNSEYSYLLDTLCSWEKEVTVDELELIADYILDHSNVLEKMNTYGCDHLEVKKILMYNLVSDCCFSFFE